MVAPATARLTSPVKPAREGDHFVHLHGVSWADYERILAIRGDRSAPRIAYLEGELELMSPGWDHEGIKKCIARLVEAWADERDVDLFGVGSWTVKKKPKRRGAEPDECYTLGARKDRPDLAIEVVWSSGGIDKLEIYRGLGVPEVWIWADDRLVVYLLRRGRYAVVTKSLLLPELDLLQLVRFVDPERQPQSVRAYRRALRGG